jgi:two-component system response regulator HydG
LIGESGVGKSKLAHAFHRRSPAHYGPFVMLRTAAYPSKRLPRAIFGRERESEPLFVPETTRVNVIEELTGQPGEESMPGAVERADAGTLYIDDVTALEMHAQERLLTLIETHHYRRIGSTRDRRANVRLVVSSPVELAPLVEKGRFSIDLYHRLSGCVIRVPPLRDRRPDIPLIANYIIRRLAEAGPSKVQSLGSDAERMLLNYDWPGNVRELESAISQAVIGARSAVLQGHQLPASIRGADTRYPGTLSIPLGTKLEDVEREVILQTLRMNDGNKSLTADLLGISRRSLYDKLLEYRRVLGIDLMESKDKGNQPSPEDG